MSVVMVDVGLRKDAWETSGTGVSIDGGVARVWWAWSEGVKETGMEESKRETSS